MREVPAKKYRIKLASDERSALEDIRDRGLHKSAKFKRALALLFCDEGPGGGHYRCRDHLGHRIGPRHPRPPPQALLRGRSLEALERIPRETGPRQIKVTGKVEADITCLACSDPPEGQLRWTLGLIAGKVAQLEVIASISRTSVRRVLKKTKTQALAQERLASCRSRTRPS